MQKQLVIKMSNNPQKLMDLQWLEEELQEVSDETNLIWNSQKRCVEHQFSDENYEVEYTVLEHWAHHVGANFKMNEAVNREGYCSAYIYA